MADILESEQTTQPETSLAIKWSARDAMLGGVLRTISTPALLARATLPANTKWASKHPVTGLRRLKRTVHNTKVFALDSGKGSETS